MEGSNSWWPMKGSNACWPLKGEGETSFSHLFTFPPNKFYLNLFFSIDLKVLFYHGSISLFIPFFPFPWPTNYNHASWCNKSSTHSSLIWFWLEIFFLSLNHGVMYDHVLWASSHTNEWRTALGVIFRFDVDVTSLWWKSQITRSAPSFWNWTPSSLVLSHFSKVPHLGDFVASRPRF
jgi:hypothetical protein